MWVQESRFIGRHASVLTISLHWGDESSIQVQVHIWQVGGRSSIHHNLIQHLYNTQWKKSLNQNFACFKMVIFTWWSCLLILRLCAVKIQPVSITTTTANVYIFITKYVVYLLWFEWKSNSMKHGVYVFMTWHELYTSCISTHMVALFIQEAVILSLTQDLRLMHWKLWGNKWRMFIKSKTTLILKHNVENLRSTRRWFLRHSLKHFTMQI